MEFVERPNKVIFKPQTFNLLLELFLFQTLPSSFTFHFNE